MRYDRDERAKLTDLRRQIAAIEDPKWEAERVARRKHAREQRKRIGKRDAGQRQPQEVDKGFRAFIRRQPCAAAHLGGCSGRIECAHVRYSDAARGIVNPGMQRKNHDRHSNPLCNFHHQSDQHRRREQAFWAEVGVNAYDNAARLFAEYQGS